MRLNSSLPTSNIKEIETIEYATVNDVLIISYKFDKIHAQKFQKSQRKRQEWLKILKKPTTCCTSST